MPKLVIVIETKPVAEDGPDPTVVDPHEIAEAIIGEYNEHCGWNRSPGGSVEFVSAAWNGPGSFMRPADHDARIRSMERESQWVLGSSGYASALFTAYEHPAEAERRRKADGADA
jgi:hypothetical protein